MQVIGFMGPAEWSGCMGCGLRADLEVVSTKKRELALLRGESVPRTKRVAPGREPVGAKRQEGDGRTPEGRYTIDWRNARSKYHLSLHISHPGCGGCGARAGDWGGSRRGHHAPRFAGWGTDGGRLDAGVYRGDG
jgi:hypothetical protein